MGPHSECAAVQHVPATDREEQKPPVAALATAAMCDGLVEGDFKGTEVVQRPNTVSKSVFCL